MKFSHKVVDIIQYVRSLRSEEEKMLMIIIMIPAIRIIFNHNMTSHVLGATQVTTFSYICKHINDAVTFYWN